MTAERLCKLIGLNPNVQQQVIRFSRDFDFSAVQTWLEDFRSLEKMKESRKQLQRYLGEDEGNLKILSCMLKGAADLHAFYQDKNIEEEIYFATMRAFTRFLEECYERTGTYAFDRAWWTTRQAGGHLFRIGELEYEITAMDGSPVISIHIPSDADFRREACDASLSRAKEFFARHFPQYNGCRYICHSWLLAPELQDMLAPDSNILNFQKRFQITVNGQSDLEFIEWVYKTYEKEFHSLPEQTQLQRNLKKFLLGGGMLSDALGVLVM